MKYVGWGIYLKPDIYIKDYENVIRLHKYAMSAKNRREHMAYCKKIIEVLTTVKKARFWHPMIVNRVLKLADMIADKIKTADNETQLLEKLKNMVFYIAPRVNMTPDQFKANLKGDELQEYYDSVNRIKLENERSRVLAAHNPVDYYKEIIEAYKNINSRIEDLSEETKLIKENIQKMSIRESFAAAMV